MKTIETPADYNDPQRTVLKFVFEATGTEPTLEVRAISNAARPNVQPCKGCDVVLDNHSISKGSLYELSGLTVSETLGLYGVTAFGFCDEDSIAQVKADWERLSQQALDGQIKKLSNAIENAKTLKRCIG